MLKEYIQGVRSLSIIGMCKNAGKTTVLNKLIAELERIPRPPWAHEHRAGR